LASNSPARARVLSQINLEYDIIPSEINETLSMETPESYVIELSLKKAETVGERIKSKYMRYIVLGCDTIVIDPLNQIIGKPKDRLHAKQMLDSLSGKCHQVLTGCTIIVYPSEETYQQVISTEVEFRNLSNDEIEFYLSNNEWMGKAGAYAIQGIGSLLIKEIRGDYYNVVGLPVHWVWQTLLNHYNKVFLETVGKKG
ncbi:MAG: Maf family protein, partial [Candidatus Hodarchaeales archaeon]